MTREVVTVSPDATVVAALDLIRSHDIRHLPVLEGDRLVGIVTDRDLRLALDPGGQPAHTSVADMMTRSLVVVAPDAPMETAAALLSEHRIGCLPVTEDQQLVGIITESDVLRAFVDLMVGREPHSRVEILAPHRPGELARIVRLVGIEHGINITGVVVPPALGDRSLIVLHLEADGIDSLLENLRQMGYEAESPALVTRPA
jgi:acetoin utilization protein AcuB